MLHDALFFKKYGDRVRCLLCPHNCVIAENGFGLCSVRANKGGVLKTINYGEITAMAIDPIEKKPLYHFKPGKNILSVGSFGCNFSCDFCQNYSIAQYKANSKYFPPEELIKVYSDLEDNIGIAFTYNEPSIWYEYIYETSKKLKETDQYANTVLVTNGYIETEPLLELLPYIDAMNIDLKSFEQDYYKKICGGQLEPVLTTIKNAVGKCHVEITTLLVNGLNDSEEEVEQIASYLGSLDKNIPLHLSRYFPNYKMDDPPTKLEVMLRSRDIAKKHLNYVYLGNMDNVDTSTYCPKCTKLLIERNGFFTNNYMDSNVCPECGFDTRILL
ncbi:MAG TPA: AmmeMemoRadiSam system radical SAM enzyme [Clostridia bacterium]|nr:AmmeMemoRadiSam system radical SAM enzyme [Clostridia bacterium]